MIFGDLVGLKFPDIRLTGEETPPKEPHLGNLSRLGIEPGPAASQARKLPPAPQRWTWTKSNHQKSKQKNKSVINTSNDCTKAPVRNKPKMHYLAI